MSEITTEMHTIVGQCTSDLSHDVVSTYENIMTIDGTSTPLNVDPVVHEHIMGETEVVRVEKDILHGHNIPLADEVHAFSADIVQMMNLIVHTFYSDTDVFLRELISNASDAIKKLQYRTLTDESLKVDVSTLDIRIIPNKTTGTLVICDKGIGMTKQEMIDNLGTIARSGTKRFMESISSNDVAKSMMIGKFGVGFYSAYLVSDRVNVWSRHPDSDATYMWSSDAGANFSIARIPNDDSPIDSIGTRIELYLKKEHMDYLEESKIKRVFKQHSEFVSYPVRLETIRIVDANISSSTEARSKRIDDTDTDLGSVDHDDDADDVNNEYKTVGNNAETGSIEILNTQKPIWMCDKSELSTEDYSKFYKSISNDWEDHLSVIHFSVEGNVVFRSVLFVPRRVPFGLFDPSSTKSSSGVKLYVRRVYISDDVKEMVPDYLSFIRGVVDSDDLPLNISREVLQKSGSVLRDIRKHVTKKALEMIGRVAESHPEDYITLYRAFSKKLKLGVHEDDGNRSKLAKLLRFFSSTHKDTVDPGVSLDEYISRMPDGQPAIYFLTGESMKSVGSSPFLEGLTHRGYEVLLMVDAIDEYVTQQLREYGGKKLVCASKEGLDLGPMDECAKSENNLMQTELQPLCTTMKGVLGDRVSKVVISNRVVKTPCVLVTGEFAWSANMTRIIQAQALHDDSTSSHMDARKVMELNGSHPIIVGLSLKLSRSRKPSNSISGDIHNDTVTHCDVPIDKTVVDTIMLLFEGAMLVSGFALDDPSEFVNRINQLVERDVIPSCVTDVLHASDVVDPLVCDETVHTGENIEIPNGSEQNV
jgi:molecular chaperone HtpG